VRFRIPTTSVASTSRSSRPRQSSTREVEGEHFNQGSSSFVAGNLGKPAVGGGGTMGPRNTRKTRKARNAEVAPLRGTEGTLMEWIGARGTYGKHGRRKRAHESHEGHERGGGGLGAAEDTELRKRRKTGTSTGLEGSAAVWTDDFLKEISRLFRTNSGSLNRTPSAFSLQPSAFSLRCRAQGSHLST
jgi:hypothetical protein